MFSPDARKRSRGPNDGPSQPTQIPRNRHSVQLSRLRRALPVSAGLAHELRPPLRGVVGPSPTTHQPACTDQPGPAKKTLHGHFWLFLKHWFLFMCSEFFEAESRRMKGTLMFSSVQIDPYQIVLRRHIGLALFICSRTWGLLRGPVQRSHVCLCASHLDLQQARFLVF